MVKPAVMGNTMAGYFTRLRDFAASRRGNVAMMFGLALVPLTIAGGVGLDLARGMMVRSAMSDALDAFNASDLGRLPVTGPGGAFLGPLTRGDVLLFLAGKPKTAADA